MRPVRLQGTSARRRILLVAAVLVTVAACSSQEASPEPSRSSASPTSASPTTTAPARTVPEPTAPGPAEPALNVPDELAPVLLDAGIRDPGVLERSRAITVTTPGALIENLDIRGAVVVKADNVTIRNVRVRGSSSTALIKIDRDIHGTTIEDCTIVVTNRGANGAIGYLGYDTTVRRCDISGYADGIKAESGGLYERNYIHMSKPAGASKHLDGIQGSGDTGYTIRNNVIDADVSRGGNAAVFVQAWNGAVNSPISNITVEANFLRGGNYTVYLEGGKDLDGSDPASWLVSAALVGNTFDPDGYRYGLLRVANCSGATIEANTTSDGQPLQGPCG